MKKQVRMAELIRSTFKERLFREPLWQGDAVFPSPDQLRGRIIIQAGPPSGQFEDDSADDEVPPGVAVSEMARQIHENKKATGLVLCCIALLNVIAVISSGISSAGSGA